MAGLLGGSGGSSFPFKMFLMVLTVSLLFPMFIMVWTPPETTDILYQDEFNALRDDFARATGSQPASEEVWGLTGIYTPYSGGAYGTTSDGWIFGGSVSNYTPSQYNGDAQFGYAVQRASNTPLFKYTQVGSAISSENGSLSKSGISVGDFYTRVHMDKNQKSNIFFVESQKNTQGDKFYYNYTGYRYSFAPMRDLIIEDKTGEGLDAGQRTSSLSLIWYSYYGQQGISGQLVISGSDSGVASITADQIIAAFIQASSSAKFTMVFNGVDMNIYIQIDPNQLARGYTIEQCFNDGYWTVMVTSNTVLGDAIVSPEYSLNPLDVWFTICDMVSFNMEKYGAENGSIAFMVSIIYSLILYAFLLALVVENIFFIILPAFLGIFQSLKLGGIL